MVADDLLALSELLDEALDLDDRARDAWLEELQRTQPQIAGRLEALLKRTSELKTDHLLMNEGRSVAPEVLADVMENTGSEARLQGFLLQPGAQVGPYRLIKPLGEGGMASVWLAERSDGQLKREVALKLLHAWRNSKELVERFARERDMLAGLVHPHIARLYDAGVTETGQPWIALEYVEGIDLATYADRNRLPIRARVESMLQVMSAVQHAHQNLIVHRDIKPTNILVNTKGEVRLLDFGIAKLLHVNEDSAAETELTKNAGRALTIRYAAPEQITGDPVTTATDVYALGLVMYELLTGASPRHGGKTQIIAEQAALSTDVLRPSRAAVNDDLSHRRGNITARELKTALAGDLDTIILKALAREPARRYRTVDAFAADLHAWLEQRPIAARAPSFTYQLKMLLVRQRVPVAIGCAALIALGGAGVFAWKQRLQASQQSARAEQVQLFLENMLSEAEPEGVGGQRAPTAKSLLDASVERARVDYRAQPIAQGSMLTHLGNTYMRLGETAVGEKLLREAISVISQHARPDEPSLQVAKAHLGDRLMNKMERQEGMATLNEVLRECRSAGFTCEIARGIAHMALAKNPGYSDAERRSHLQAARDLFNKQSDSLPRNRLKLQALVLSADFERARANFSVASDLLRDAERLAAGAPQKLAEHGLFGVLQSNLALDSGDFAKATKIVESTLADLANSDRKSTMHYLHVSRAHIANYQGLTRVALNHAEEARKLSLELAPNINQAYALRYAARAHAMEGNYALASQSISESFALLRRLGVAETKDSWLDMVRAMGEIEARKGEYAVARTRLAEMLVRLKSNYASLYKDLANTLNLLGAVSLAMGDANAALATHLEEIQVLKGNVPDDHPLRLRAELQVSRARDAIAGGSAPSSKVIELAKRLQSFVPEDSVHYTKLQGLLSGSSSSGSTSGNLNSLFLVF